MKFAVALVALCLFAFAAAEVFEAETATVVAPTTRAALVTAGWSCADGGDVTGSSFTKFTQKLTGGKGENVEVYVSITATGATKSNQQVSLTITSPAGTAVDLMSKDNCPALVAAGTPVTTTARFQFSETNKAVRISQACKKETNSTIVTTPTEKLTKLDGDKWAGNWKLSAAALSGKTVSATVNFWCLIGDEQSTKNKNKNKNKKKTKKNKNKKKTKKTKKTKKNKKKNKKN